MNRVLRATTIWARISRRIVAHAATLLLALFAFFSALRTGKSIIRLTLFLLLSSFLLLSPPASAAPTTMNFQGRLLDTTGTPVADGLYNMQFKLYDASSGGTLLWSEIRENNSSDYRIQVTNGLFTAKLGERTALSASLFSGNSVYFEITQATPATATCNTASCASWESPMAPRHQLSTSAYAFNSETLDGLDSTAFAAASGSGSYIQNGSSPQTANFNIQSASTTSVGGVLKAASGQTADILQFQNSSGTALTSISATGVIGGNSETGLTLQAVNQNGVLGGTSISIDNLGTTMTGTLSTGGGITAGTGGSGNILAWTAGSLTYGNSCCTLLSANLELRLTGVSQGVRVLNSTASAVGFRVTGAASQSGDLLQLQNSSENVLSKFNSNGDLIIGSASASNSSSALKVQSTSAVSLLTADTSTMNITIGSAGTASSLTLVGSTTANRPASPTDGMMYYDTDTKQLLTYTNGKWQADSKTATFIVAASNSPQAVKDGAQYLATGTNDQTQIDAAIAALPTSGGKVYLAEGTYNLGAAATINKSNVVISGAGKATILKRMYNEVSGRGVVWIDSVNNVTLQDLMLDGNKATYTTSTNHGIYISYATKVIVERTVIDNFAGNTISTDISGGDDSKFINNVSSNSAAGVVLQAASRVIISDNTIYGHSGTGVSTTSYPATITNNDIYSNAGGIASYPSSTITSNRVQNNTNIGISATGTITGNYVSGNATGINISDGYTASYVANNHVISNTGNGIYADNQGAGIVNAVVSNYIASNGSSGIALNNRIENMNINGNSLVGNGGTGSSSSINASAYAGGNNSITNNIIVDTAGTGYAINIAGSANYLSGNTFSGTGATSINDTGTDTIYAGQSKTQGGLDIAYKQANSTTAFQIQNANGVALLGADTTNGQVLFGSYNGGTNPLAGKLVIANSTNANTVTLQTGTTSSSYSLVLPTAVGTTGQCIGTTVSGSTSTLDWTTCDGSNLLASNNTWVGQNLLKPTTNGSTTFNIQTSTGSNVLNVSTSDQTVQVGSNNTTNAKFYVYASTRLNTLLRQEGAFDILQAQAGVSNVQVFRMNSNGHVLSKNLADSTTAFDVQNAGGTSLFTADTTNMKIVIAKLDVTGLLTVGGHIASSGTAPTIAAGAAACTSPTVSVTGTDTAGTVTVTTGTGCAGAGKLATVTFNAAYGAAPRITLTAANANASSLQSFVDDATTATTTFDVNTNTGPTNTTTYKWYYHVIQ